MKRLVATASLSLVGAFAAPGAIAWPGGAPVRPAGAGNALGSNLSGLAVDGRSGLWAVRDSGALVHLERSGTGWKPSSGGSGERTLRYPGGKGSPDAEGVTTANDATVYVAAERNSDASNTSRNSILRFDTAGNGALTATKEWTLESVFGTTPANTGVEGVAFVPDSVFVAMNFRTDAGKVFAPADYPDHGDGLFATAIEGKGDVVFVALHDDGRVTKVGVVATGIDAIMDLSWSAERQELWATCDNHCKGQAAVLHPGDGAFQVGAIVQPPAGMEAFNDEGFVIVPTCTNGTMVAVWSDDAATGGTSLREADLPCGPIVPRVAPEASAPNVATTVATTVVSSSSSTPIATTTATVPSTPEPAPELLTTKHSGPPLLLIGVGLLAVGGAAAIGMATARKRRTRGRP
jgi:Esterase-like activity of phytase